MDSNVQISVLVAMPSECSLSRQGSDADGEMPDVVVGVAELPYKTQFTES